MKVEIEWIPIKVRELTDEERESYDDEYCFMWDCPLPDDNEEVLVTLTYTDRIAITTFYDNYFEDYDWEDIKAWASSPKPYKANMGGNNETGKFSSNF